MKKNKSVKNSMFLAVFDTVFIMILCFATLLSAMLMKGKSDGLMDYSINWITLGVTFSALVAYMIFIISQSEKGLKDMINHVYGKKETSSYDTAIKNVKANNF